MSVKIYDIKSITYKQSVEFIKVWHYAKSCPPALRYFGLFNLHSLIGVAVYGFPAMKNQARCYGVDLELRRLCCIDDTPKNTEAYFIGATLRLLKKEGYSKVLSLADPEFGHTGVIYRASNFKYLGTELGGGSRRITIDGVVYHSRTCFALFGASGLKGLNKLLPNADVKVNNKQRKHVYVYELKNKKEKL